MESRNGKEKNEGKVEMEKVEEQLWEEIMKDNGN